MRADPSLIGRVMVTELAPASCLAVCRHPWRLVKHRKRRVYVWDASDGTIYSTRKPLKGMNCIGIHLLMKANNMAGFPFDSETVRLPPSVPWTLHFQDAQGRYVGKLPNAEKLKAV